MKWDRTGEPPARRLGVLYVASFFTITLLSGLSQALVLRELTSQTTAISSITHLAGQWSQDQSLSVPALALLADDDSREREKAEALGRR